MEFFTEIALQRLQTAMANGEFDNLPGRGRALPPDPAAGQPPEWRLACKVLRNAGLVPPEVQLLRDMDELRRRRSESADEGERALLLRRLRLTETAYRILQEQRGRSPKRK
jgi:hypothetical protein